MMRHLILEAFHDFLVSAYLCWDIIIIHRHFCSLALAHDVISVHSNLKVSRDEVGVVQEKAAVVNQRRVIEPPLALVCRLFRRHVVQCLVQGRLLRESLILKGGKVRKECSEFVRTAVLIEGWH